MAHPDEAVVRRFIDAMVARHPGEIAGCFADDVVFHIAGRNALSGEHRGKQAVMTRLFQAWEEAFGGLEIDVHDVLADDDHVVVLSDRRATRDDRSLEMRSASVYHVRDGLIAEAWLFEWDPYAIDDFLSE
ncbi:MAG TPA: nuclear transport factor 2 family protein [Actinomycetota bacterium]|nr:nuclear transport factor 2 family protein [Actinomycetota bacterium]